MTKILLSASLTLLLSACAAPQLKPAGVYPLRNDEGHVIGHKQVMLDLKSGTELDEVVLYRPRIDARGQVIGYEETMGDNAVLRDLEGRRIGTRQVDLRSRGSNPGNPGITTLFARETAAGTGTAGPRGSPPARSPRAPSPRRPRLAARDGAAAGRPASRA